MLSIVTGAGALHVFHRMCVIPWNGTHSRNPKLHELLECAEHTYVHHNVKIANRLENKA